MIATDHGSLRAALDALTASPLQSVELEADEVLFTDDRGASYTCSRRVADFIQQAYGHAWLVWLHEPGDPEDPEEGRHGGGMTMRRKEQA